jgi:hypothetical protein
MLSIASVSAEEPSPLIGLDPSQIEIVLNNLQQDYVTCAAFFTLTSGAIGKQDSGAAEKYMEVTDQALSMALQIGEIVPISEDATRAKYEMALDGMADKIDGNFNNFSILMNEHLKVCESLMNNSEQRTEHWIDQL